MVVSLVIPKEDKETALSGIQVFFFFGPLQVSR